MDELMTQDEFDKLIEDIAAQYARAIPKRAKAAYAAALARIAALEAERRWIPVAERVPEGFESVPVLQWSKLTQKWMSYAAYYSQSTHSLYEIGTDCICYPDYWMPLPAFPSAPEAKEEK